MHPQALLVRFTLHGQTAYSCTEARDGTLNTPRAAGPLSSASRPDGTVPSPATFGFFSGCTVTGAERDGLIQLTREIRQSGDGTMMA